MILALGRSALIKGWVWGCLRLRALGLLAHRCLVVLRPLNKFNCLCAQGIFLAVKSEKPFQCYAEFRLARGLGGMGPFSRKEE